MTNPSQVILRIDETAYLVDPRVKSQFNFMSALIGEFVRKLKVRDEPIKHLEGIIAEQGARRDAA